MQKIKRQFNQQGFTIVELLLSTIVITFVALISLSALRGVVSAREAVDRYVETNDELRVLTAMIKQDLSNLYRDVDNKNQQFVLVPDGEGMASNLTFNGLSLTTARNETPESDLYEIQYSLTATDNNVMIFAKRKWPMPDRNQEELKGVITQLSNNMVSFQVKALNSKQEWVDEWPEEEKELPKMIEVSLVMIQQDTKRICRSSFYIAPSRWPTEKYFNIRSKNDKNNGNSNNRGLNR